ncbi:MAG: hypothetical protein V6Z86_09725 [Hyphomicrobiales bacterium]
MTDELVGEGVGRVGDDLAAQRLILHQEIDPPAAMAAIVEVGCHDVESRIAQLSGDCAVAAGRFPNRTLEGFRLRRPLVEFTIPEPPFGLALVKGTIIGRDLAYRPLGIGGTRFARLSA